MQLAEYVRDVALDRLLTYVKAAGDLRVAETLGDELQHLELPVGELTEHVRLVAPGPVQLPHHPRRNARVQYRLPGGRLTDGGGELFGTDLLEDVGEGTGSDGGKDVLVVVVGGKHDHVRAWGPGGQAAGGLDAVHARHDQVHQRHVGGVLGRKAHGLLPTPRLGDHGDVRSRL